MIGEVLLGSLSAYRLDAVGNLIRLSGSARPDALIPFACELVTPRSEIVHPLAWTITPDRIIQRMRMLPLSLLLETEVEAVIVSNRLPTAQYPFIPAGETHETDETIEQALEVIDNLRIDDPTRRDLEVVLNACGVFRIPRTEGFFETIHIKASGASDFEYVSDGWMSSMKVYRRSVVRFS